MSEVGFEPTPTYVDQNTRKGRLLHLESGALDHSAILTTYLNGKIPLPCTLEIYQGFLYLNYNYQFNVILVLCYYELKLIHFNVTWQIKVCCKSCVCLENNRQNEASLRQNPIDCTLLMKYHAGKYWYMLLASGIRYMNVFWLGFTSYNI